MPIKHLFISYARPDKDAVDDLVRRFPRLECQPWVDSVLHGGQSWWDEILRQITDCDAFVAILSQDSLNSEACQKEFAWAVTLGKPVLPIAVKPIGPIVQALPPALATLHIVNWTEASPDAAIELAGAVMTLPPAPAAPQQLPQPPSAPLSYLGSLGELVRSRPDSLTHDQQHQIASQLRSALGAADSDERDSAQYLVDLFHRRSDLYADVAADVGDLIADRHRTDTPKPTVDWSAPDMDASIELAGALITLPPAPALPEVLPPRPQAPLSYMTELADAVDAEAMDPQEQASILDRLQQALNSPDEGDREGAQFLVEKFGRRDDLEIDIVQSLSAMGIAVPHTRPLRHNYSTSAESQTLVPADERVAPQELVSSDEPVARDNTAANEAAVAAEEHVASEPLIAYGEAIEPEVPVAYDESVAVGGDIGSVEDQEPPKLSAGRQEQKPPPEAQLQLEATEELDTGVGDLIEKRVFQAPMVDLATLNQALGEWYESQGLDVQTMAIFPNRLTMQVRHLASWRKKVGLSPALQVMVRRQGDDRVIVEICATKLSRDVLATIRNMKTDMKTDMTAKTMISRAGKLMGGVAMAYFTPTAAAATAAYGYGIWKRMRLPERTFQFIEEFLGEKFNGLVTEGEVSPS